jgi:hypothetical protein
VISHLSNEAVKKIKKLGRMIFGQTYLLIDKRAFWMLCYCYFVNGKDEIIHWKQLEKANLMGTDRLAYHLNNLNDQGYLLKRKTRSEKFYTLTDRAKQLMEQQLNESEILSQLRSIG